MKTKRSILCTAFLLLAACGEKAGDPSASPGNADSPRDTRGSFLLTTDLPPELIEGTPKPIIIPGVTPLPQPRPMEVLLPPSAEAFHDSSRLLPPDHLQPPPIDRERYGQLIDNP